MLDHANVTWTVECMREAFADIDVEGSRVVSYLPMAHIAERNVTHYGGLAFHYEVTTCPEPGQVAKYLPQVRPQVFFAVPRVWEKIHAGVMAMASADPERKAQLDAALDVGLKVSDHTAAGEELPPDLAAAWAEADAGLGRRACAARARRTASRRSAARRRSRSRSSTSSAASVSR